MKMREFGKLGIKGSAFGLGCMRFPMIEKDGQKVFSFRVNADEVGFADTARNESGTQQNTGNTFPDMNGPSGFGQFEPIGDGEFSDDTLPF